MENKIDREIGSGKGQCACNVPSDTGAKKFFLLWKFYAVARRRRECGATHYNSASALYPCGEWEGWYPALTLLWRVKKRISASPSPWSFLAEWVRMDVGFELPLCGLTWPPRRRRPRPTSTCRCRAWNGRWDDRGAECDAPYPSKRTLVATRGNFPTTSSSDLRRQKATVTDYYH